MERAERVSVGGLIVWLVVVVGIGGGAVWLSLRALADGNSALVLVGLIIVLAIGRFIYKGIRFARSMASFDAVNEPNAQGYFPLHVAAGQGDRDQVSLLLANGAHVDVEHTMMGFTPLHLAALEEHVEVCRLSRPVQKLTLSTV